MMMYSLPMAFEESSLQSRILGMGVLVLVCTKISKNYQNGTSIGNVATSEFVVRLGGPVKPKGSLATAVFSLSVVNIKTLLNPPSFLSHDDIEVAPRESSRTLLQSASKSNAIWRDSTCSALLRSQRPLV